MQAGLPKVLAATTGTNTERYIHAIRGLHATEDSNGAWTYALEDALGSVRGTIGSGRQFQSTHNYDPYGNPDTTITGFAFTGEPRDANGLQYHRARYYNPALAIFPSLDPYPGTIGRPMSLNGYSYVEGNTPNRTDPTGMCSKTQSDCTVFKRDHRAFISCMNGFPWPPTSNPYLLYTTITAETMQYFSASTEFDCLTRAVQNEVGTVGSRIEEQAEWVTWAILNRRAVTRELDYQTTPTNGGACGSNGRYSHCAADCRPIEVNERIARVVRTTINNFQYRSEGADPTYGAAGWRQNPNRPFVPSGEELTTVWPQIADLNGRCGDFFCRKRKAFFPNDAVVAPCQGSDYVESVSDFYDRVENRQNGLNNFYGNTRRSTRFNMTRDEASTYLGGCVERIYVTTVNTCNAGADGDNICWITGNSEFRP